MSRMLLEQRNQTEAAQRVRLILNLTERQEGKTCCECCCQETKQQQIVAFHHGIDGTVRWLLRACEELPFGPQQEMDYTMLAKRFHELDMQHNNHS